MKVRTQLLIAFFLLAILPLAGIVLYSYVSSQGAFRRAVEAEAQVLAGDTGKRLATVRAELEEELAELARLPVRSLVPGAGSYGDTGSVYADLTVRLGQAAEMVESAEFTPAVPELGTEPFFIVPSRTLARAIQRLEKQARRLDQSGLSRDYLDRMIRQAIREQRLLGREEFEALEARKAESKRLLGSELTVPVLRGGTAVGQLRAMVPASLIVREVLSRTPRDAGAIPYALDDEGRLYVERRDDRSSLAGVPIASSQEPAGASARPEDWIVAEVLDSNSGLTFGIARPVAGSLRDIRRTAVRNFGYGLAMVLAALLGVLLISTRMTRKLEILTAATERLAAGDLETRVPVGSRNEFGLLAETFNRMASELRKKQEQLVEGEQRRREQEVQRRLLEAENERKSQELAEARELQLSLLPRNLPLDPDLEIAVFMKTATEVGGDYYDFFPSKSGALTTAIGDAAGHGARAGTMVTVVKGLLTVAAGEAELPRLLGEATRAIKKMELGRMNMALTLLRIEQGRIAVSAAGMPPVLHYSHAERRLQEIELVGTPLGSLADASYQLWESDLGPGDTLLLMTDGFAELLNQEEETLGYPRVRELFEASVTKSPEQIIEDLSSAAEAWTSGLPPHDDITFVVLRRKAK